MWASRSELFREGGDRESERLDLEGAELVEEEEDEDWASGSRGVWSVIAAVWDRRPVYRDWLSLSHHRACPLRG
jgi:hypothetical protein